MRDRWRGDAVRIVGAGALGTGLARALAARGRTVELYSRGWGRTAPRDGRRCEMGRGKAGAADVAPDRSWPAGVAVYNLVRLAPGPVPIVLCLSSPERAFIGRALADGAAEVPRSVVARASVEALERDLPWPALAGAPLFVVTNPVELVCELVARRTGSDAVAGFGMATDRERVVEALARGFGEVAPATLAISGLHARRAIPLLASHPELAGRLSAARTDQVAARLGGREAELFSRLLPAAIPERLRAHELLHTAVRAITAAEFDGPRPPVKRPVAVLTRQVDGWLAGADDAPAEVSGPVVRHGARAFLGGRLTALGFVAPELDATESDLLARELADLDEQVRALLGSPG